MGNISNIKNIRSIFNVSRETSDNINIFKEILLEKNKEFNLISKNDEDIVDNRHIMDSAQVIDLINKNSDKYIDMGSGAGFPGIILAIMLKELNKETKIYLYEKSLKKSKFLSMISEQLGLNVSIINKNICNEKNLEAGSITARAFRPVNQVFEILINNFKNYRNLILFLGERGKQSLLEASKVWNFEYKEHKSITSNDSLIINIKNIKKKID